MVAQAIDYAAWVEQQPAKRFVQIYAEFAEKQGLPETSFDEAFNARFSTPPR